MALPGGKLKSISLKRKIEVLNEVEKSCKKKTELAKEFGIPKSTLSGIIKLTAKAEEFARLEGQIDWKCSSGWLARFKKRHNITYKSLSAERQSVNEVTTDSWAKEVLKTALTRYNSADVCLMPMKQDCSGE